MYKYILGVDPGQKGALTLLDNNGFAGTWDMPVTARTTGKGKEVNPILLAEIFLHISPQETLVVIESVHAMPKQGVTSSFNFGKSVGLIDGLVAGLNLPSIKVTPQKWKKHFGLIGKPKDASRSLVLSRYPMCINQFKHKKDCDRADALLIALWYGETQQ